jgi:hypothetical protein
MPVRGRERPATGDVNSLSLHVALSSQKGLVKPKPPRNSAIQHGGTDLRAITFRAREEDWVAWRKAAKQAGMTTTAWVRMAARERVALERALHESEESLHGSDKRRTGETSQTP